MSLTLERYVTERFDALADRFRPDVAPEDFRLRALLDVLGPLDGRRVLDLGCGQGRFARRLREAGACVIGQDPSRRMLARAAPVPRVRAAARRLPYADAVFDAVLAVEVLEHVPDLPALLDEAHRVLRPGGMIAIIDKNATALDARRPWLPSLFIKWLDERRGRWMYPPDAPFRERWFRPGAFRRELESRFVAARVRFPRRPEEASWVFARFPQRRLFVLWTARKAVAAP